MIEVSPNGNGIIIAKSLDQIIRPLIYQRGLESSLRTIPSWAVNMLDQTEKTAGLAFENHDEKELLAVHRSLKMLYELHLVPHPIASGNQYNPYLTHARQILEYAWMESEDRRSTTDTTVIPTDQREFAIYFQDAVSSHPAANHRLYHFLAEKASLPQFVDFFRSEYPLDVRFFDVVVLSALGTKGLVRREVAGNLWDESGRGLEDKAHTTMYENLMDSLSIDILNDGAQPSWQALAGYNLFLKFGLNRQDYYRYVGCLAATEVIDPANYDRFMNGARRLGLDQFADLGYYEEHIEVDVKHGSGWIDNVMLPILEATEDVPQQFLKGAEMRLNTAGDYYDSLYEKLMLQEDRSAA